MDHTLNLYRFRASQAYDPWNYRRVVPPLTKNSIMGMFIGAAVQEVAALPSGGYDIFVQVNRKTHHDALTEIESALGQLGFNVLQAEVTEVATAMIQGALLGGGTGGAGLAAITKNPSAALVGALIGLAVGAIVGHEAQTLKACYRAHRIRPGCWQLTELPLPGEGFGAPQWST